MALPSPSNLSGPTALKIGAYTFVSDSTPDELGLGAVQQTIVVTDMPGGSRVTESMGAHPLDVEWSATFWGPNVAGGITALRAYCVTGQEYFIGWGSEQYYCKVRSITPSYRHVNRAGFRFVLVITRDANGALSVSKAISVDAQLQALQQSALTQYNTILSVDSSPTVIAINPALYNVTSAVSAAGPLAQATPSALAQISGAINQAISKAQPYINALAPFAPQLIPATRLLSVLQLMSANVARGQAAQTITKQGGSLYETAAQFYGDATLGLSLMATNGLASPHLPSGELTTLLLPPFQKAS